MQCANTQVTTAAESADVARRLRPTPLSFLVVAVHVVAADDRSILMWAQFVESGNLGPTAILMGIVGLVMWGLLEPRRHVKDVRADRDARLAEQARLHSIVVAAKDKEIESAREDAAQWRSAFQVSDEARQELAAGLADVTEVTRTAVDLLHKLPQARRGGG